MFCQSYKNMDELNINDKIKSPFDRKNLNINLNSDIEIYKGAIELKTEFGSYILSDAKILIEWLPKPRITFQGTLDEFQHNIIECTIYVNNTKFGQGVVDRFKIGKSYEVRGIIQQENIKDQRLLIDRIEFSLVNLPIKHGDEIIGSAQNFWRGGFEFVINNALFRFDSRFGSKRIFEELDLLGGFAITHHAFVRFDSPVELKEGIELLQSILLSLRFLTGQDLGFCFVDYLSNSKNISTTYFFGKVSPIHACNRLVNMHSNLNGTPFFENIYNLTKDNSNKSAISDLVHWHNMANTNQGYLEGSLVIAQIGIELLYNWIICEKKEMTTPEDSRKITAISKINTLMSMANISILKNNLSNSFNDFCSKKAKNSISNAIVILRNHLVHSNEQKRIELEQLDEKVYFQARNILLNIIEIYILALGKYKGNINNIISKNPVEKCSLEIEI
jgi:hypothetical protein